MVACDTLGAYGSTKRYKSVERIKRINDHVVLAASGEISDFQYILKLLDELTTGRSHAWPAQQQASSACYTGTSLAR